ncbi:MAG: hypothetical protein LKJ83_10215 [Eubacteriaceae bacterium]|nr:hypothetical protein [Eubacteriaceae bacterium]
MSAVTACPGYHCVTQPDGTKVRCKTAGDEYFHYCTNASGNVIQRDPQTKVWKQLTYSGGVMSFGSSVWSSWTAARKIKISR